MNSVFKALRANLLAVALLGLLIPTITMAEPAQEAAAPAAIQNVAITGNNMLLGPMKHAVRPDVGAISVPINVSDAVSEDIPEVVVTAPEDTRGYPVIAGVPLMAAIVTAGFFLFSLGGIAIF